MTSLSFRLGGGRSRSNCPRGVPINAGHQAEEKESPTTRQRDTALAPTQLSHESLAPTDAPRALPRRPATRQSPTGLPSQRRGAVSLPHAVGPGAQLLPDAREAGIEILHQPRLDHLVRQRQLQGPRHPGRSGGSAHSEPPRGRPPRRRPPSPKARDPGGGTPAPPLPPPLRAFRGRCPAQQAGLPAPQPCSRPAPPRPCKGY